MGDNLGIAGALQAKVLENTRTTKNTRQFRGAGEYRDTTIPRAGHLVPSCNRMTAQIHIDFLQIARMEC
jgi:hypothetical protein